MAVQETPLDVLVANLAKFTGKRLELEHVPTDSGPRYRVVELVNDLGGQRKFSGTLKPRAMRTALLLAIACTPEQ